MVTRTSTGVSGDKDDDENLYVFQCDVCGYTAEFDADEEGARDEAREEFMEHCREDHDGFIRYELKEA